MRNRRTDDVHTQKHPEITAFSFSGEKENQTRFGIMTGLKGTYIADMLSLLSEYRFGINLPFAAIRKIDFFRYIIKDKATALSLTTSAYQLCKLLILTFVQQSVFPLITSFFNRYRSDFMHIGL
jgi:hypothetical protein